MPEIKDEAMQFTLENVKKMTDWKSEPDLQLLKNDFEMAKPSHDAQITKIEKWNNLLEVKGDAQPPKTKHRSSVQPKLIRRQAEWRYSALSEPFLSSDKLFKVDPVTFEDEASARQNELLLNYQFRTKIDRVWLIDGLVRATVDDGTCFIRTGWNRVTKTVPVKIPIYSYYPLETQEQAQMFQQALALKQADPHTFDMQASPELKAAITFFEEEQQATLAIQTGEEDGEEEEIIENKPTVEIIDPRNIYIDPSCNGELEKALFIIVSFETNKAELVKGGDRYKNLDKIDWASCTPVTDSDHNTSTPDTFQFTDPTRRKVVAYEYWGYFDINNDGTLTSFVATWIGNTLIRMELNPFPDGKLPFVTIPYSPVKQSIFGESDAEMLEDNQKILGAVTRGMIDLMANSANGQKGFAKGMLDALNRRRYENGSDYEFNPQMPTSQGIIEHKYPELPQSALVMLNMQNQEAEALTGVKSFSGGLSGNAYGNVATGIRGMLDAAAKREMAILRRIAKGVCDFGRKIMAMNAEFMSDREVVRVTNSEFVAINKDEIKGEFDLKVDISTFEVDNTKAQDLGFMLQTLGPNMAPAIYMMILAEISELKRMPALAQKLRTWQPQPDPVQQQMQQLELQAKQMEIQVMQSEIMLNQAKAKQAMATGDLKELDRIEQERGVKHGRKMVEMQAQARGNQNLEITKALLKPKKVEESEPNVDAAIGHQHLSSVVEDERLLGPK